MEITMNDFYEYYVAHVKKTPMSWEVFVQFFPQYLSILEMQELTIPNIANIPISTESGPKLVSTSVIFKNVLNWKHGKKGNS